MRDLLIRYLLGELDRIEQRQLEARLESSAELQRELAQLRLCFSGQDDDHCDDPAPVPQGLAERTAGRVTDVACGAVDPAEYEAPKRASQVADVEPPSAAPQWSLADFTVAAGVCLAVSMLLLPALRDSRDAGRRRVCENNLGQLGMVLTQFAADHGGYYPRIGPRENAGSYIVPLIAGGYIVPEELAVLRLCPGSPTTNRFRNTALIWNMPPPAELEAMAPDEIVALRRQMSPSYAYRLPYLVGMGGQLDYVPNQRSRYIAVMADAPGSSADNFMPENHGCYFVQVLYQDNHVGTQRRCTTSDEDDHLFTNDQGVPAAGRDRSDTVLGRSEATLEFGRLPMP